MAVYDLCVVGAGMIGSAAARHASRDPAVKVCLVGPSEPEKRTLDDPRDIFGSHYDEGRIHHSCGSNLVWAKLAQESVERYREIEKESGIKFHEESGMLWIGQKENDKMTVLRKNALSQGLPVKELSNEDLNEKYPYLRVSDDDTGILEEETAGYINPRRLLEAQKAISRKQGCKVFEDTVTSVERRVQKDGSYVMSVMTERGNQLMSKAVLLATGAFTNFRNLISSGERLDQRLIGIAIALVEVDEIYRKKIRNLPSMLYIGAGHPDYHTFARGTDAPANFYMIPPIKYPDGRYYIKLGFTNSALGTSLSTSSDVKKWFVDGKKEYGEHTAKLVATLFKGLTLKNWRSEFCVVTATPTNLPYIDKVHGQLGVAIGGNGHAAKSSDEIGRLAADMMSGRWSSDIPRDVFALKLEKQKHPQAHHIMSKSKL